MAPRFRTVRRLAGATGTKTRVTTGTLCGRGTASSIGQRNETPSPRPPPPTDSRKPESPERSIQVVPKGGLEPPRCCHRRILNPSLFPASRPDSVDLQSIITTDGQEQAERTADNAARMSAQSARSVLTMFGADDRKDKCAMACPICNGSGFAVFDGPPGWEESTQARPCTACHLCPSTGQRESLVFVRGHGQCSRCGQNVEPCCQGAASGII